MSSPKVDLLIAHIDGARRYTRNLLEATDLADWFRMPEGGVTHVAWQVGHLAIAQYRLALWRIRGARPEDGRLIPESFQSTFGYGSVPSSDPADFPSIEEIQAVFDAVHRQTLHELASLPDPDLDAPVERPTHLFSTKQGALLWCGQHEFLHAGQIGLIRRLLGKQPIM